MNNFSSKKGLSPQIIKEWHPTKNEQLNPHKLTYGSEQNVWWQCLKHSDHIWKAIVYSRTKGAGCPYCSGRRPHLSNCLMTVHPQLVNEWHPTKNGTLTPQDVTPGFNKQIWWRCLIHFSHEWQAHINKRIRGQGCPYCSNRRVDKINCLQTTNPQLALEWHLNKNGTLTPQDVISGSNKQVWWQCPHHPSHEWLARIGARTNGSGCPYCNNKKKDTTNCLQAVHPQLSLEWHPIKNKPLTPFDIFPGSHLRVWWQCLCDPSHEWQSRVSNRIKVKGCPSCTNHKFNKTSDLQITHPNLVLEWNSTKNGELNLQDVAVHLHKCVWWQCLHNPSHEWQDTVSSRLNRSGCPCCSNRKVDKTNCLQTVHPQLALEWHSTKNGKLTPQDVVPGSHKRVWWQCLTNSNHEWLVAIEVRIRGSKCPFCSNKKADKTNCLQTVHPQLALEWHPTKNGKLTPQDLVAGSHKRVWWQCPSNPNHEWLTRIADRMTDAGCPYCINRKVNITNCLQTLYPEITLEWHPSKNGKLTANDVVPGSSKKVWWQCQHNPSHEWLSIVKFRTEGNGCPYCSNKKVNQANCLQTLHPQLALEWHPSKNSTLTPHDVVPGSGKRVWWQCPRNPYHEWQARIVDRAKGSKCPFCHLLSRKMITPKSKVYLGNKKE